MAAPSSRSSTGLDDNVAAMLAYLGGAISGIVLLTLEKQSRYVRFHAMQSTITFLLVLVVHLVLMATPVVGWMLVVPFIVAVAVLWLYLMFKAFRGQAYKLPYIGDWAERQLG